MMLKNLEQKLNGFCQILGLELRGHDTDDATCFGAYALALAATELLKGLFAI